MSANAAQPRFAAGAVLGIAAAFFLVEFLPAFGGTYGYFVDELYYLACAKRLALGYVDHPPLAPLILRVNVALLGDSLPALRLLPALAGGATVFLAGRMALRVGGGALAQTFAALSIALAQISWIMFSFFSMNCFEILLWTTSCWIVVEICRSENPRLWLLLGLVLGIAFENKHTIGLLAAAIGVGTLLTPLRRHALDPWPWLGALAAVALSLPNVWWQIANDWASLEFYANLARESNLPSSPLDILVGQMGAMNPGTFPVWLSGAIWFFSARGRRYRTLGWIFATVFGVLLLSGVSRPDRIAGVYPVMFAGGGVLLESLIQRRRMGWIRYAVPALAIVCAALLAPAFLPFPPEIMERHPLAGSSGEARREVGTSRIPLPFAHRMGSKELVDAVAAVYRGLEPAERSGAILLADDFGAAGALELFGPEQALPSTYSPHNSYFLWGQEAGLSPPLVIAIGVSEVQLRAAFGDVERVATHRCTYCMGWRDDVPIRVARSPTRPLREVWPEMRRYGLSARKLELLEAGSPE